VPRTLFFSIDVSVRRLMLGGEAFSKAHEKMRPAGAPAECCGAETKRASRPKQGVQNSQRAIQDKTPRGQHKAPPILAASAALDGLADGASAQLLTLAWQSR
jgi:hypothetical protein